MSYYILNEKNVPFKVKNALQWASWFEDAKNRIILQDRFTDINDNEILVSTIFTGIDVMDEDGPNKTPYLWETMVFRGKEILYEMKYCCHDDAIQGHGKALRVAKYGS